MTIRIFNWSISFGRMRTLSFQVANVLRNNGFLDAVVFYRMNTRADVSVAVRSVVRIAKEHRLEKKVPLHSTLEWLCN